MRFFNEARAASLIQHPGIVEVLDCEVHTDGRAFIVMELLRGDSLRSYIERSGKLDSDLAGALAICRQMVSALAAAHAQGIVHRDLKPDNVFLHVAAGRAPAEPIVKLLDFGIAKLQGDGEAANQTRTGAAAGDAALHVPGAVSRRATGRQPLRHLFARLHHVRDLLRPSPVRGAGSGRSR